MNSLTCVGRATGKMRHFLYHKLYLILSVLFHSQVHEIHPAHAFLAIPDRTAKPPPLSSFNDDDEKCEWPLIKSYVFWI